MKTLNTLLLLLIIAGLTGCKKDLPPTLTLIKKEALLTHDSTYKINIDGATTEKIVYESHEPIIASVDENGLITGNKVGKTTISISFEDRLNENFTVNVISMFNTFDEPIIAFGMTKAQVKAQEKRTLKSETTDGLLYNPNMLEKWVLYGFTNGKLVFSYVILSSSHTTELGRYLDERYLTVSVSPYYGWNINKTVAVTAELQPSFEWLVTYFPFTVKSGNIAVGVSKSPLFQSLLKQM